MILGENKEKSVGIIHCFPKRVKGIAAIAECLGVHYAIVSRR